MSADSVDFGQCQSQLIRQYLWSIVIDILQRPAFILIKMNQKESLTPPLSLTPSPEPETQSSPEKPNNCGILQPQEAVEIITRTLSLSIQEKEALATALNKIDLDPVMCVKVKPTWVPPANVTADHVLDDIATWRMPQGRRRDVWDNTTHTRRWLFHFSTVAKIASCQNEIKQIHPYCFGPSSELVNIGAAQVTVNSNIFADVVVINKTGIREDDVFDYPFFEF